jgi:putative transposase
MARLARLYVPGCSHHVIQRGNNRTACFLAEADYQRYLTYLNAAAERCKVRIHAYVLMTNHAHLLLTPPDAQSCGKMMQSLGRQYVGYFNRKYQRSGTLWEGRYKSTLVDTDNYFFTLCRYIELNPVRAGMVSAPGDYRWSSYHGNATARTQPILTRHALYLGLGPDSKDRQTAYRQLFNKPLPQETVDEIRFTTNQAWVLGCDSFKRDIADVANRKVESSGWGGDRKSGLNQGV